MKLEKELTIKVNGIEYKYRLVERENTVKPMDVINHKGVSYYVAEVESFHSRYCGTQHIVTLTEMKD